MKGDKGASTQRPHSGGLDPLDGREYSANMGDSIKLQLTPVVRTSCAQVPVSHISRSLQFSRVRVGTLLLRVPEPELQTQRVPKASNSLIKDQIYIKSSFPNNCIFHELASHLTEIQT